MKIPIFEKLSSCRLNFFRGEFDAVFFFFIFQGELMEIIFHSLKAVAFLRISLIKAKLSDLI